MYNVTLIKPPISQRVSTNEDIVIWPVEMAWVWETVASAAFNLTQTVYHLPFANYPSKYHRPSITGMTTRCRQCLMKEFAMFQRSTSLTTFLSAAATWGNLIQDHRRIYSLSELPFNALRKKTWNKFWETVICFAIPCDCQVVQLRIVAFPGHSFVSTNKLYIQWGNL